MCCIHIIRQLLWKYRYLFSGCMFALITKVFKILQLSYVQSKIFFCRFHNIKPFVESRYSLFFLWKADQTNQVWNVIFKTKPNESHRLNTPALFGTNFSAIPCSNCTFNSSATRTKRYYPIYKVHCTYLLLIQCLSLHYSALCTAHHKVFKIRDCKVLFLVQNTVAQKIHIIQFWTPVYI